MSYTIVIHQRESTEPTLIPLPGLSAHDAEADRQALLADVDEARLGEAPVIGIRTRSGYPAEPLAMDPHAITGIDLVDGE